MGLKETLKQKFSNENNITLERYKAAKFIFIISSFLFFLNFYFVGANFYSSIFFNTLGIMYIILLLSLVFFLYFFIKKTFVGKVGKVTFVIIFILLLLIFAFLAIPVTVDGGIFGIL